MVHNLHCTSGKQLLQGFTTDGFFAEYAVVDWENAIILPENLQIERCAPLFCAGITGNRRPSLQGPLGADCITTIRCVLGEHERSLSFVTSKTS